MVSQPSAHQDSPFDTIKRVPFSDPDGFSNPSVAVLADGRLGLAFRTWGDSAAFYFMASGDGGMSWTEAVEIPRNADTISRLHYPTLIALPTGRVLVYDDRPFEFTPHVVAYSDDGGASWKAEIVPIPAIHLSFYGPFEGEIWRLAWNNGATTCWAFSGDCQLLVWRSENGLDWSDPETLFPLTVADGCFPLKPRSLVETSSGELRIIFSGQIDNCSERREGLFFSISEDGGRSWSDPMVMQIAPDDMYELLAFKLRMDPNGGSWIVATIANKTPGGAIIEGFDIGFTNNVEGSDEWKPMSRFTEFDGNDLHADLAFVNNRPLVFFTSQRGTGAELGLGTIDTGDYWSSGQIWYGELGRSVDSILPPSLFKALSPDRPFRTWLGPDETEPVAYLVSDEGEIRFAELVVLTGGDSTIATLRDDGQSNDDGTADRTYGGTLGPFGFGQDKSYFALAVDDDSLVGLSPSTPLEIVRYHNVGSFKLALNKVGIFGEGYLGTRFKPMGAGQWPDEDSPDNIGNAGLWLGQRGARRMYNDDGSVTVVDDPDKSRVVHYEPFNQAYVDWSAIPGSFPREINWDPGQAFSARFSDANSPWPFGVEITQSTFGWRSGEAGNGVVLRNDVRNISAARLDSLYLALYVSVGIGGDATDDQPHWERSLDMLYATDRDSTHLGVLYLPDPLDALPVLGPHTATAVEDVGSCPAPNVSRPNCFFRTSEKQDRDRFEIMTLGIDTTLISAAQPGRWILLMTSQPFTLEPDSSYSVSFGLAAGEGLNDLRTNASALRSAYLAANVHAVGDRLELPDDFDIGLPYPNPASTVLNLPTELLNPQRVVLTVFDVLGRKVHAEQKTYVQRGSSTLRVPIGSLAEGVYLLRVDSDRQSSSRKFVVVR